MTKIQNSKFVTFMYYMFGSLRFEIFDIVSNFGFRYSNLLKTLKSSNPILGLN